MPWFALGYTMVYGSSSSSTSPTASRDIGAMVAFSVIGALAPSGLRRSPSSRRRRVRDPVCMLVGYAMSGRRTGPCAARRGLHP